MGDDEIIRRRLLIDGDGTGDARMMAKFTRGLVKWCFADESLPDSELQHNRLLTNLAGIEQSTTKWDNILQMNSVQLEHYSELKNVTSTAVTDAQDALTTAKLELSEAREVRNHGLQYHALAKLIQEHPPRSPTATKLDKLSSSLAKLKSTRDQLDDKLNLRKKQLHVLFTALHQLQTSLETDEASTTLVDISADDVTSVKADDTVATNSVGRALVDLTGDGAPEVMECS